jgi:hypothetical protein
MYFDHGSRVKMDVCLEPEMDEGSFGILYTATSIRFRKTMQFTRALSLSALLFASITHAASSEDQKTIRGWVLDSACAFTKGLAKPISRECALACAHKGSPLVILQDDGSIFWPISESMPAEGQNARLLPYAGKRVTVTGKVYSKGGSEAVVIDRIAPETK